MKTTKDTRTWPTPSDPPARPANNYGGSGTPPHSGARPLRILIAAPLSDCHSVSPKLLETHLTEQGYAVKNLGACCSTGEIAEGTAAFRPDAIFLCAQNGHALMDLRDLPVAFARRAVVAPPVYLGGNVTVGSVKDAAGTHAAFAELGIEILDSFEEAMRVLAELAGAKAPSSPVAVSTAATH